LCHNDIRDVPSCTHCHLSSVAFTETPSSQHPAAAQFGIKRKGTNFQELQKEAAAKERQGADPTAAMLENLLGGAGGGGGAGDLAKMQELFADALKDPETLKQLEQMGEQFTAAMDQLSKMSPEQLEKQMQAALSMLTEPEMVDTVIDQRDAILQQLEAAKTVPAEELARMKADPAYFELKMRESFDQMKDILSDPAYLKLATEAMGSIKGGLKGLLGDSLASLNSDEKIEEARLEMLKGDNPLAKVFESSPEMKAILNDPQKWKETVKEGYNEITRDEL
jgi:hypothetical protein